MCNCQSYCILVDYVTDLVPMIVFAGHCSKFICFWNESVIEDGHSSGCLAGLAIGAVSDDGIGERELWFNIGGGVGGGGVPEHGF